MLPASAVGGAAAVRARMHGPERRARVPGQRAHRPRRELRRRAARRRRDAAAGRRRPVPDDRDAARLRRREGQLPGVQARGRPQPSTEPGSATTYHWNSNWFARRGYAVVNPSRAASAAPAARLQLAHARLRARLDPPRRPALRGARHPAPARPARRPGRRQARRARRHRHLLRRRPEPRARVPARPHPQARRLVRAVAQPGRRPALDRRRLPALAVVGPRQRAAAQRALPGLPRLERDREPRADRRADPVLPRGAVRHRRGVGLLRAGRRRRRRGPDDVVRAHPGRRALRRRHACDRRRDPRSPRRLRPHGHPGAAAAARRLDRRPVPVLGAAAGLQRPARGEREARPSPCSSPTSATRAAPTRSTPTRRSTTRAARSSTPTCAAPARRPRRAA